jgi:hypothetical protein
LLAVRQAALVTQEGMAAVAVLVDIEHLPEHRAAARLLKQH